MPYERARIYDADYATLKRWARRQGGVVGVSLVEAAGRAVDLAVAASRDAVARAVQLRADQPAARESFSLYGDDYRALCEWAAKQGVNMPEAFGRAIDIAVRTSSEELSRIVRQRGVRRAEAEAALVAATG